MKTYTLSEINESIDMCEKLHLDDFKLPTEHTSADQDLLLFVEQKFRAAGASDTSVAKYYRSLNI